MLLFVLLGVYLGYLFKNRAASAETPTESGAGRAEDSRRAVFLDGLLLLLGLVFIIGAAHLLVGSAVVLARSLEVSEWVIGVTIVAAGTSVTFWAYWESPGWSVPWRLIRWLACRDSRAQSWLGSLC